MSVEQRVPLAPVKGLRRDVSIPGPPPRRPADLSRNAAPPRPGTHPSDADAQGTDPAASDLAAAEREAAAPTAPTPTDRSMGAAGAAPPERTPAITGGEVVPQRGGDRPDRASAGIKVSETADLMRPITLSLPAALVTRLKDRATTDRVSQPEVLLDALTATADELAGLLEAANVRPTRAGLFLRTPPRGPAEPMATLSLRMLTRNVATIDDLVLSHEAPSRSALCATALRRYLGPG